MQAADPRLQHVFGVQLVRGRPFYGYCEEERVFIKVTLYNPRDVSKVASLLQACAWPQPASSVIYYIHLYLSNSIVHRFDVHVKVHSKCTYNT